MRLEFEGSEIFMPDYKAMYQILCLATDEAITELEEQEDVSLVADNLKNALLQAEEIFIETAGD